MDRPLNALSANLTKWLNTQQPTLTEFDHFVWLTLKGLK